MKIDDAGNFTTNFLIASPESLSTAILPITQDNKTVLLTYAFSDNNLNPLNFSGAPHSSTLICEVSAHITELHDRVAAFNPNTLAAVP